MVVDAGRVGLDDLQQDLRVGATQEALEVGLKAYKLVFLFEIGLEEEGNRLIGPKKSCKNVSESSAQ